MKFKKFTFNLLQENTYVVYDENSSDCAIIDPGNFYPEEGVELVNFIKNHNLVPSKVLFTHCHLDHIFGARFLAEEFPLLQWYGHQEEQYFIDNVQEQGEMFGVRMDVPPSISHYVYDGEKISVAESELQVIHTPGHSRGCVCYYCEKDNILFSGDTLFCSGIGRTDLYGGSMEAIINSIQTKLFVLPEDTMVYCGHSGATTIGYEKHSNPYI